MLNFSGHDNCEGSRVSIDSHASHRISPLLPPRAACHILSQPPTASHRLSQPLTASHSPHRLSPPITAFDRLPPPSTVSPRLSPLTALTSYHRLPPFLPASRRFSPPLAASHRISLSPTAHLCRYGADCVGSALKLKCSAAVQSSSAAAQRSCLLPQLLTVAAPAPLSPFALCCAPPASLAVCSLLRPPRLSRRLLSVAPPEPLSPFALCCAPRAYR